MTLAQGIQALDLQVGPDQRAKLLEFLDLLRRWNRVHNLTAIEDAQRMVTTHVLDCLAVLPGWQRWLAACGSPSPRTVLDVGSGGGLPGVVWAIADPTADVTCIDSVAKKAGFVRQAAAELSLPNLHAIHLRVEQHAGSYQTITARAFASLGDFVTKTAHLLAPDGAWLAMKGRRPDAEIASVPDGVEVFHVEPVVVPRLNAKRCVVWMRRRG